MTWRKKIPPGCHTSGGIRSFCGIGGKKPRPGSAVGRAVATLTIGLIGAISIGRSVTDTLVHRVVFKAVVAFFRCVVVFKAGNIFARFINGLLFHVVVLFLVELVGIDIVALVMAILGLHVFFGFYLVIVLESVFIIIMLVAEVFLAFMLVPVFFIADIIVFPVVALVIFAIVFVGFFVPVPAFLRVFASHLKNDALDRTEVVEDLHRDIEFILFSE
jgi:hypothetical protein